MPRGGARPNSGPKPKPKLPPVGDKDFAARVMERIGKENWRITDFGKVQSAEDFAIYYLSKGDAGSCNLFERLREKRDGTAVRNLNHMHDKPVEVHHTLTLGEGMRLAMVKAEERVRNRK